MNAISYSKNDSGSDFSWKNQLRLCSYFRNSLRLRPEPTPAPVHLWKSELVVATRVKQNKRTSINEKVFVLWKRRTSVHAVHSFKSCFSWPAVKTSAFVESRVESEPLSATSVFLHFCSAPSLAGAGISRKSLADALCRRFWISVVKVHVANPPKSPPLLHNQTFNQQHKTQVGIVCRGPSCGRDVCDSMCCRTLWPDLARMRLLLCLLYVHLGRRGPSQTSSIQIKVLCFLFAVVFFVVKLFLFAITGQWWKMLISCTLRDRSNVPLNAAMCHLS